MPVVTPTPCKIAFVALENGPIPLQVEPRYRALLVCFVLSGAPLGHCLLHASELPLSAVQMWALATEAILPAVAQRLRGASVTELATIDPLSAFREFWRRRPAPPDAECASIVICTRERPDSLHRCLRSLSRTSAEVLVIDNAPSADATRKVVGEFANTRYECEPYPGLSYARNRGVERARGEIIVFTDDDVVVSPDWLSEILRPFRDPNVMCVTGLVMPAELETREQALFEFWQSFHRGYQERVFDSAWLRSFRKSTAPVWEIGAGASMAIRKRAFEQVGMFDTRLGAGSAGCSEDSEFWYRLLAAGHRCIYTPAAVVYHYHRASAAALQHQMRMYCRGHVAALLVQFAQSGDLGAIRRLLFDLPWYQAKALVQALLFRELLPFWFANTRGSLEGLFYLLKPQHREAPTLQTLPVEEPQQMTQ